MVIVNAAPPKTMWSDPGISTYVAPRYRAAVRAPLTEACTTEAVVAEAAAASRSLIRQCESGVAGCFLRELHAGAEAEFGVDVGEVGLHGPR